MGVPTAQHVMLDSIPRTMAAPLVSAALKALQVNPCHLAAATASVLLAMAVQVLAPVISVQQGAGPLNPLHRAMVLSSHLGHCLPVNPVQLAPQVYREPRQAASAVSC